MEGKEATRKELEKAEQVREKKEKLRNSVTYLSKRIDVDLASMENENSRFTDDLQRNIAQVRSLMKEHSDLFVEVMTIFGDDYEAEFAKNHGLQSQQLYDALN